MPVLTITSRKGGVGKTVLAAIVAGSLAEQGFNVALLEMPAEGTAAKEAADLLAELRAAGGIP